MLLFGGGNLISHSSGECRLRVFEVEVLRGMFGPKRAKVTGGWRNYNEELYMSHSAQCIVMMLKSVSMG